MIEEGAVYIYWSYFSSFDEVHTTLLEKIDKTEKERYQRFSNIPARDKFLVSRALLRLILSQITNESAEDIVFSYGPHGKPFIKDSKFYFNVSHSAKVIVIAISRSCVGVDTEFVERKVNYNQIMSKFFNESEIKDWENCKGATPLQSFLLGWTRKEAVLKATGDGITGISELIVPFDNKAPVVEAKYRGNVWNLFNVSDIPKHLVSVATSLKECNIIKFRLDKTLKIDLMQKPI